MSVYALRVWHRSFSEPELLGYQNYPWTDGVNVAQCKAGRHYRGVCPPDSIPNKQCMCGFWGSVDRESALKYVTHRHVSGIVQLGGMVLPRERGFNASHARIVALARPMDLGDRPRLLPTVQHWENIMSDPELARLEQARQQARKFTEHASKHGRESAEQFRRNLYWVGGGWTKPEESSLADSQRELYEPYTAAVRDWTRRMDDFKQAVGDIVRLPSWADLLAHYPSVAAFESIDDALREFPLSDPKDYVK